ncbi:DUF2283 domain-containing protein [Streptomyces sp. 15-116A]|uniref:DUF2283 domain-containing protein n=1 Tax=Streptomyces sp. 15-116A TaxID=2259035 RepID=UPI0021B24130|nr:DUF2283 domain-containing protein [Streptomyces sp. 15-116A]MCT7354120.1 DUF2283 domain-containing protein [Streptomyces sp. 15-116A]
MHIEYDRENDTAYLSFVARIPDGAAVRQVAVDGVAPDAEVMLDLDAAGRMLGIEVTGARRVLPAELLDGAPSVS